MSSSLSSMAVDKFERMGDRFLYAAAQTGRVEDVRSLLRMNTNPNWTQDGETALIAAARKGYAQVVSELLENDADPMILDGLGRNALHWACENGFEEVVKVLVQQGMEFSTARDQSGMSALDLASRSGHESIVQWLNVLHRDSKDGKIQVRRPRYRSSGKKRNVLTEIVKSRQPARTTRDQLLRDIDERRKSRRDQQQQKKTEDVVIQTKKQEHHAEHMTHLRRRCEDLERQYNDASRLIKTLEQKEKHARDQVKSEIHKQWQMEEKLKASNEKIADLSKKLDRIQCEDSYLCDRGPTELDEIESELKTALERISKERARRLQDHMDPHLCVVCMENRKTILIMPCRHLCLCKDCSSLSNMTNCPLCRKLIENRIGVFS